MIPPRRAKDYADFKIRNVDGDKDNYMIINKEKRKTKSFFVFNSYKNSSRLGTQKIPIPNKLKNIIKKWMNIQESDRKQINEQFKNAGLTSIKVVNYDFETEKDFLDYEIKVKNSFIKEPEYYYLYGDFFVPNKEEFKPNFPDDFDVKTQLFTGMDSCYPYY